MQIKIRPSPKQFWAENISVTLVACLFTIIGLYLTSIGNVWVVIPSTALFSLVLLGVYRWLVLRSYVWHIGHEAITERRGLFLVVTDHIELYRIIDYQTSQTLLQRLLGLKSVILITTDKLNRVVIIKGISSSSSLMNLIRNRVENCKTQKRIYEVTNS